MKVKCSQCRLRKPIQSYYKNNARPNGVDAYCKPCRLKVGKINYKKDPVKHNELVKKHYRDNPEYHRKKRVNWYKANKEHKIAYNKEWVKNNPDKVLASQLKRDYKLSLNEYMSILEAQNQVCAICLKPESIRPRLSVDHCHHTGKIRGLLCTKCNTALGSFKDSVESLTRAINYLRRYSA